MCFSSSDIWTEIDKFYESFTSSKAIYGKENMKGITLVIVYHALKWKNTSGLCLSIDFFQPQLQMGLSHGPCLEVESASCLCLFINIFKPNKKWEFHMDHGLKIKKHQICVFS